MLCQAFNNWKQFWCLIGVKRWKFCMHTYNKGLTHHGHVRHDKTTELGRGLQIPFWFSIALAFLLAFLLLLALKSLGPHSYHCMCHIIPCGSVLQYFQEMSLWGLAGRRTCSWKHMHYFKNRCYQVNWLRHALPGPEDGSHCHSVSFGLRVQNHSRY